MTPAQILVEMTLNDLRRDVVTYDDGGGFITAVVIAITDDCRPVLQTGEYGVRRGADAFDLFLPRDYWRFVGAYRKADHAL